MKSIFTQQMYFLLVWSLLYQQAFAMPSHSTFKTQGITNQEVIHSQKLKNLFVQFQKQYLNFEFKAAQASLQKIVAMRFLKDWDSMERQMIATCYLRLAQMDELYRYKWVKEFFAFSDKPFIDEDLFPPQYVDWIKSQHKEYQATTEFWYGQNLPQDIESIVINGETFSRLGFSRRMNPNFQYRVTLVEKASQNKEEPIDIIKQNVHFSMILGGQYLINYPFEASQQTAELQRKSLMQLNQDKYLQTKADQKESTEFSYVSPILEQPAQSIIPDKDVIDRGHTEKPKDSFFKRHPWMWFVVGGVATGAILSVTLKSQPKAKIKRRPHEEIIFH